MSSDYQSLQQSNCTSCEIGADKSAYWTPILYYQHSNGSLEEVHNEGMTVYYLGRGDNKTNIQPFPPGFKMLSGVATARSYDTQMLIPGSKRPKADRVSFACLDKDPSKEQPGMTRTSCINGLRAQIHFQSCWDGVNLYKEDNSHVEYMSDLDNGLCPTTHPVPLIHLFYEVLYSVNDVKQDGGKFVFSQGDTTGYGFHGDFMNGWDPATLKAALDQGCANTPGGVIADCAAFRPSDNPKTFAQNCPERPALVDEPVHGMIPKLPGCIKMTSGPGAAKASDMSCSPGADQAAADQASMNGIGAMGNSSAPYTNSTASSAGSSSNMGAGGYGKPKISAQAAAPSLASSVNNNGPSTDSPSDSESKSYGMVAPSAPMEVPSASSISYSKASSMSQEIKTAAAPTPCSATGMTESATASSISYGKGSSMSKETKAAAAPTSYSAAVVTESATKCDAKPSSALAPEVTSSSVQYGAEASSSGMAPDSDDSKPADYHGTEKN